MITEETRAIRYKNDVVIKYLLGGEDEKSSYIRNTILEGVLGFPIQYTEVINGEIISDKARGKKVVLDILAVGADGTFYDIEMETSSFTLTEQYRFQKYGFQLANKQMQAGDEYTVLKPMYQIIFINHIPKDTNHFLRCYKMRDQDGIEESPCSLVSRIYVHLPMINAMADKFGLAKLNSFEKACYLLENNEDSAILNIEDRLVKTLMEKFRELKNNEKLWSWEDAIRRGEAAYQMNLQESIKDSREKGLQEGLQKGLQKGLQEGLQEGKLKGMAQTLQTFMNAKYQVNDIEWVQSLCESQLQEAVMILLSCDTYEQLQQTLLASK